MKTGNRNFLIVGFVVAAGALTLWSTGDHDAAKSSKNFELSRLVTFTHKLSTEDQNVVRANLNKAMGNKPNSNTTAASSGNPELVNELRDRAAVTKFRDLELCLESRNPCDIPQTEPRSSDIWVSDRAIRELQGLRLAFSQLSPEDQNSVHEDLAATTEWALQYEDDNVREEGLRLARLSMDPDHRVPAIIAALRESVSAPLYDLGLSILRDSKDSHREAQEDFFAETIQSGGYYASEEVARQILPYLNEGNVERFVKLRRQLPVESNTAVYLNENIKAFEMAAQGG